MLLIDHDPFLPTETGQDLKILFFLNLYISVQDSPTV